MPDYKGKIHRMWVSRTVPSLNGDKSLKEGQCIVIQTCTSQTLLALNTILIICELLERPDFGIQITGKMGSLLEDPVEHIEPSLENTFQPVSDFGEKRILPITNKTVVVINKIE